jgi:hypothetical protein
MKHIIIGSYVVAEDRNVESCPDGYVHQTLRLKAGRYPLSLEFDREGCPTWAFAGVDAVRIAGSLGYDVGVAVTHLVQIRAYQLRIGFEPLPGLEGICDRLADNSRVFWSSDEIAELSTISASA